MNDDSFSDFSSVCSDQSYISDLEDECKSFNYDLSNGSPIDINNFNIVHFNINSITAEGRLDQLSDICKILNLDVLIITESKLDETIPINLITIPGYYEPIRRDRYINGRNGGGVLMYIADHLVYQQKCEFQSENYEHIWVDLRVKNVSFAINALYRPPTETTESHNLFLETTENILQRLSNYNVNYKIIASDLNFGNCYCKYPILNPKPLDAVAPDLFSSYGFSQLIDIPTRVTDNTTSLIDLIFEYNVEDIVCHGTLPKIADHEGILVSYNIDCQKPKSKTKTIYDYKNADVNGLINHIKHFDFETAVFHHPKTEQAQLYSKVLTDAFALFVPCKTVTIRTNDQPWTNTYTRLLLRKKNRHYRFYKKVNSEYIRLSNRNNIRPEILTKYLEKKNRAFDKSKDAANNSKMANRRAKLAFINSVNATMNNYSISAKKKFNILQKLMKNNKFSPTPPLLENGETISEPKEKSEIFNSFFASKSTVNDPDNYPTYLQKLVGVPNLDNLNTSPL